MVSLIIAGSCLFYMYRYSVIEQPSARIFYNIYIVKGRNNQLDDKKED